MKEKIHKLRVKIDGLAQLVESLNRSTLIVNKDNISDDMDIEELSKAYRSAPTKITNLVKGEQLTPPFNPNLYECHKSLLLSKAWLGKVLAELGEEAPYKNDGKRKSVEDIEKTADTAKEVKDYPIAPEKWEDENIDFDKVPYVEKIDWLREEIRDVVIDIDMLRHPINITDLVPDGYLSLMATQHLSEARFHLGFKLARIKEQEEKK